MKQKGRKPYEEKMNNPTKEQQDLINQIDNDEFTEAELDFLIFFMKEIISNRS